ncbi:hypothetical protein [Clostridium sp.]|jgi:hypothetical protein|uniref:hypothetical protein n=1 Tax=Clostridium sp. TaxID=1506 RepID=UPI003EE8652C
MKKNQSSWIIMISTFISVTTMGSYSGYISNSNQYEKGEIYVQKVSEIISNLNQDKNNVNEAADINDNIQEDDVPQKEISSDNKSEYENTNDIADTSSMKVDIEDTAWDKYIYDGGYVPKESNSLEDYNYTNEQNEQSVFKVSTGKIMENLTSTDKIKLLYISIKLGRDNYKKVEEYLYASDAENGVLKALKLMKDNLSEKEYEKVRIIAGKFIDMEEAEKLY